MVKKLWNDYFLPKWNIIENRSIFVIKEIKWFTCVPFVRIIVSLLLQAQVRNVHDLSFWLSSRFLVLLRAFVHLLVCLRVRAHHSHSIDARENKGWEFYPPHFQRNVSLFLEKEPSASVFNNISCIAWMFPGMSVWAVTWAKFVSHDWLFVNPPGEWSKNNERDSVKNKATFLALYSLLVYVVEVACSALFGEIVVEFLFCKFMERAVGKLNKPTKKKKRKRETLLITCCVSVIHSR